MSSRANNTTIFFIYLTFTQFLGIVKNVSKACFTNLLLALPYPFKLSKGDFHASRHMFS